MTYFDIKPPWLQPDQPSGWVCPKCGKVYSPLTPQCWTCNSLPMQPFVSPPEDGTFAWPPGDGTTGGEP